jgi:hypothetical protein
MKKLVSFGVFALILSLGSASAQIGKVGIGIAGTGQLPIGNFSDHVGVGIGGLGDVEVGMYPGLALTARSGYLYHFEYRDETLNQIPVLGGVKFTLPASPIYVTGELGADFAKAERTSGSFFTSSSTSHYTYFSWDAGVGSAVGPVDLRLTFDVLDASNLTNSMTLGLTLGFTLWST